MYCKFTVCSVNHQLNHITDSIPAIPHTSIAKTLNDDRKRKLYTYAAIVCGDKRFEVHKVVIGSQSAFFKAKIDHWEADNRTIDMSDLDSDSVETIIEFMYTGKVASIDEHAPNLLAAAEKYQLFSLKNLCEKALVKKLSDSQALLLLKLASTHNASQLQQKVLDYINAHPIRAEMSKALTENFNIK